MLKKIIHTIIIGSLVITAISCDTDFAEESTGSSIVSNDKFDVANDVFAVQMKSRNVSAVRVDNIGKVKPDYILGTYNNGTSYKKIKASIVSQLSYVSSFKTTQSSSDDINKYKTKTNIDSVYTLDKVVLKIPYAVKKNQSDVFEFDGIINPNKKTSIQVLRNETYLNSLDPSNTKSKNKYFSDYSYKTSDNLTANNVFEFVPKINNKPKGADKKEERPLLSIPLNKQKMKAIFWDKFQSDEFKTPEAFQDYFKGIVLKSVGEDGCVLPVQFNDKEPSIEFYYKIFRTENKVPKDTLSSKLAMKLSGITNAIYETTTNANSSKGTVAIQGTSGSHAEINLLSAKELEGLKAKKILVNDAELSFFVDQSKDKTTTAVPQKLLIYKEVKNADGIITSEHISDAYKEPVLFGGELIENKSKMPYKYTFKITDYLNKLVKGTETLAPLILKVYNESTDDSYKGNEMNGDIRYVLEVGTYNNNPRGVTIFDGSIANKSNKSQLKVSYSVEKIN